jgi:hypothetical protein
MNENAKKLYNVLMNRDPAFPMSYVPGGGHGFFMGHVIHACGAPACIKGYAEALFGRRVNVATALGIDADVAEDLFYPGAIGGNRRHPWRGGAKGIPPIKAVSIAGARRAAKALKLACEISEKGAGK